MSQTIYEERRSANADASMEPFVKVLIPFLEPYGLPPAEHAFDHLNNRVIGNPEGPRLEYIYDWCEGNLWQSHETRQILTSHGLVHATTSEPLTVLIDIHDVEWAGATLELRFSGAEAEIEELKKFLQPAVAACVS